MAYCKFIYKNLAEIYFQQKCNNDVLSHIMKDGFFDLCDQQEISLHKKRIRIFLINLNTRCKGCRYDKKKLFRLHKKWLEKELVFTKLQITENRSTKTGRPTKSINECSEHTRRRKLKKVNEEISDKIVKESFFHQIRPTQNKKDKIAIIEQIIEASPDRTKRVFKSFPTPIRDKINKTSVHGATKTN